MITDLGKTFAGESNDEFDDARERESQESTLLERNWLPEEELDVQGPISRAFSSD